MFGQFPIGRPSLSSARFVNVVFEELYEGSTRACLLTFTGFFRSRPLREAVKRKPSLTTAKDTAGTGIVETGIRASPEREGEPCMPPDAGCSNRKLRC